MVSEVSTDVLGYIRPEDKGEFREKVNDRWGDGSEVRLEE